MYRLRGSRLHKQRLLLIICGFWPLFFQHCVCVPPKFPNQSITCIRNSDCPSGERCISGRCSNSSLDCTNGSTRSCVLTSARGPCRNGRQLCRSGQWDQCLPSVQPTTEACNGLDDNCDGQIDESFSEKYQLCTVPGQQGPCAKGEYRDCRNGRKVCQPITPPRSEGPLYGNCNDGVDNDCDGFIDDPDRDNCTSNSCKEGERRICYPATASGCERQADGTYQCQGACRTGIQVCTASRWGTCVGAVEPTREICGNQVDEDCSGKADDGACNQGCQPGDTRICYTGDPNTQGVGICKSGTQRCQPDQTWGPCEGEVKPQKEFCPDQKDNDCNGKVDDCTPTGCKEGESQPCYDGPAGTDGVGECAKGKQICDANGKWGACQGAVTPIKEVCGDSKDNDCNGKVDDCATKLLASGSWDKLSPIMLWDITQGTSTKTYTSGHTDTPIYAVRFSADGKYLASASQDKQVILWNPDTHQEVWKGTDHTDAVYALSFHPQGKMLFSGSGDKSIIAWDVATGKKVATLSGHGGAVYGLDVSKDGKLLASASGDGKVILWDLSTNKATKTLSGHSLDAYTVAFHPQGQILASGGRDNTIIIWDVAAGTQLQTLTEHSGGVTAVAFSPDGKLFAAASSDQNVSIWEVNGNTLKLRKKVALSNAGPLYAIAFHPQSTEIACGTYNNNILTLDTQGATKTTYKGHNGVVSSVAYRP